MKKSNRDRFLARRFDSNTRELEAAVRAKRQAVLRELDRNASAHRAPYAFSRNPQCKDNASFYKHRDTGEADILDLEDTYSIDQRAFCEHYKATRGPVYAGLTTEDYVRRWLIDQGVAISV